jgi:predicted membrane-bound spermidine synthase
VNSGSTTEAVITTRALMMLVAIEGFTSLAYEVIALRRIVPYVGSSITVTAPAIAIFLAALALGYVAGSRVTIDFERRVLRNFIAAAAIGGVMLSSWGAAIVFGLIPNSYVALALYLLIAMAPPAYFLAQTVPVLANVVGRVRAGEASGVTLAASTAGSVLGALTLSLVIMQTLGVRAALLLTSIALLASAAWFARRLNHGAVAAQAITALVPVLAMNFLPSTSLRESAYAEYQVITSPTKNGQSATQFLVNRQVASELRETGRRADYIEHLAGELERAFRGTERRILVLGAGGFTLSLSDDTHHYTYVDIDPAIKDLVEEHFLKRRIRGAFVVDDARSFVVKSAESFDAIVVDVYSSHVSIPSHLTTLEFWLSLRPRLAEKGLVLVNLVLEPSLTSPYSRNLLATIRSALGECAIAVLAPRDPLSNVELTCRAGPAQQASVPRLYTDDLNRVDRDRNVRGH